MDQIRRTCPYMGSHFLANFDEILYGTSGYYYQKLRVWCRILWVWGFKTQPKIRLTGWTAFEPTSISKSCFWNFQPDRILLDVHQLAESVHHYIYDKAKYNNKCTMYVLSTQMKQVFTRTSNYWIKRSYTYYITDITKR